METVSTGEKNPRNDTWPPELVGTDQAAREREREPFHGSGASSREPSGNQMRVLSVLT